MCLDPFTGLGDPARSNILQNMGFLFGSNYNGWLLTSFFVKYKYTQDATRPDPGVEHTNIT